MARRKKYVVCGPLRVHEMGKGETVTLDPEKPETQRLLAREQIALAPSSRGPSADVASTDDGSEPSETEE